MASLSSGGSLTGQPWLIEVFAQQFPFQPTGTMVESLSLSLPFSSPWMISSDARV